MRIFRVIQRGCGQLQFDPSSGFGSANLSEVPVEKVSVAEELASSPVGRGACGPHRRSVVRSVTSLCAATRPASVSLSPNRIEIADDQETDQREIARLSDSSRMPP